MRFNPKYRRLKLTIFAATNFMGIFREKKDIVRKDIRLPEGVYTIERIPNPDVFFLNCDSYGIDWYNIMIDEGLIIGATTAWVHSQPQCRVDVLGELFHE